MATKTEYHPDGSTTEWVSADRIAELEAELERQQVATGYGFLQAKVERYEKALKEIAGDEHGQYSHQTLLMIARDALEGE